MTAKERTDKMFSWLHEINENMPRATKTGLTFGWRTVMLIIAAGTLFVVKHYSNTLDHYTVVAESNNKLLIKIDSMGIIKDRKLDKLLEDQAQMVEFRNNIIKQVNDNDKDISELFGHDGLERRIRLVR